MENKKLQAVIASALRVNPDAVNELSSMDTLDEWDSLAHMNLIIALEEEFAVSVPDEDAANMSSVELIQIVLDELVRN